MNKFYFKGRLTKDVEIRTSTNGSQVSLFTIAVNRKFKNEDGTYTADFFNITAFGKTAEFINKYFSKGQEILVEGRIQNRSYDDQNGQKRYVTDYIAENVEFCGSRTSEDEFITVDTDSDELPF